MKKEMELISESDFDSDSAILIENLAGSMKRQKTAFEQSQFHLSELADEIVSVADDALSIRSVLDSLEKDSRFSFESGVYRNGHDKQSPANNDPSMFREEQQLHWATDTFFLKMCMFRELGVRMAEREPSFFPEQGFCSNAVDAVPQPAIGKIVYQKNHYTDRAFLAFSSCPFVRKPRATYLDSFTDVCEYVYNGFAEFGILPIGNSKEGKLMRLITLLQKYELKIAATLELPTEQGSVNDLILIRKFLDFPVLPHHSHAYLEFSFVPDSPDTLWKLQNAARFCKLNLIRMDTLPVRDDSSLAFYPVFEVGESDLTTFYTYLSIDLPQAVFLGYYQKIQESPV